jgi:dihydropteroate synthase
VSRLRALERHTRRVQVMGILNRTPDSFYDGGSYIDDDAAHVRVDALLREGVDIIDVGAESTRPGAERVPAAEQISRLGSIVSYAVSRGAIVSIDTTLPEVAAHAVREGARIINSVSLEPAAELGRLAARSDCDLVLTHCRGEMRDMAGFSAGGDEDYGDVVDDVAEEWRHAAGEAMRAGLSKDRLVFDPGLGFAKNAAQSLTLCARLAELKVKAGGHRLLAGVGRKSFLARAVAAARGGEPPPAAERLGATLAACLDAAAAGADILRVHDVAPVVQALAYARSLAAHRPSGQQDKWGEACSRV